MITEKEILAQLNQGKSVEDIANSFTFALNSAKATYEAENIKEREKKEICADISLRAADYLALCGITDEPIDVSDIQDLLDLIVELGSLFNTSKQKTKKDKEELDNLLSNLINDILNAKN